MASRTKLFISYSHADDPWLKQVRGQLAVLEREGLLEVFADTQLQPGEAWQERLHSEMSAARVGLLLISDQFLSSDFIRNKEVPRLFDCHAEGGMLIYPLLVRPCAWEQVSWLSKLQLRPQDTKGQLKALSLFPRAARDQALANVTNEIARMVTDGGSGRASSNGSREAAASNSIPAEESNDGTQKALIKFTLIRLVASDQPQKGQPWHQVDRRKFRRTFELAADPAFDIMVANNSNETLVIDRVGIRIVQRTPGAGGTMGVPKPVEIQSKLSVHCPEEWKRFDLSNDQSWTCLRAPIEMKKNDSSFRFSLLLENFCDIETASSSELRFCIGMDDTRAESESIWLLQ